MSANLLEQVIGPYGALALLFAFVALIGSGKLFVTRGAYDRETSRVDRYDELVQQALGNSSRALDQQERVFAEHATIITLITEVKETQRSQVEREGYTRERERERDERGLK